MAEEARIEEARAWSRRRLLKVGMGAAAAVGAARLWTPARARAQSPVRSGVGAPTSAQDQTDTNLRPIPFVYVNHEHVVPPVPGGEPSTIYDFSGLAGVAQVLGTGVDGTGAKRFFGGPGTDMRFFQGSYLAMDGTVQQGTFIAV